MKPIELKRDLGAWSVPKGLIEEDEDELAAVPVLRFPHWIDEPLRVVSQLLALGFDMVVRFEVLHYVAGKRLGAV